MFEKWYAHISEEMAQRAKEAYSFYEYVPGSATAEYKKAVDECYQIACEAVIKCPKEEERIKSLFDRYVGKLADNMNAINRNTASCPSVMIAGGSNFPVAKKERQNKRDDALRREWQKIDEIPEKIRSIGNNTAIYSDEDDCVERLQEKVDALKKKLESAKAQNAYYRKHGTMKGFFGMSDEVAEMMDNEIETGFSWEKKPFPDYELASLRNKIKAAESRITSITAAKEAGTSEEVGEGYRIVENAEMMRIQFFFDGKPPAQVISILKEYGFRWAPSVQAWQRQLNSNGRWAAKKVKEKL